MSAGADGWRPGCALVTGGSRGIGAATAATLAAEGWPVGIVCRDSAAEAGRVAEAIAGDGGEANVIVADIADPATPDRIFAELEDRWGSVAVLVNNAGITADGLAPRMTDERWSSVLSTNLSGAFRMTRRALGPMMRARWGRVVNVGSIVGRRANPGQANYAAAKAGLEAMARTVAAEVGRRGITVNTVAPGLIATRLTENGVGAGLAEAIPARRPGTPQEVAACIGFLASERASYVNGTTITVDGGLTA
ncbi:MAG: 3-oxoacyl-ACP reductase FabG [Thermoleophilia bacterium]|nr:3-oxoacyl-ACP reductase FabG [Thermoleophilia bacterium]